MGLDTTHGCWHGAYSAFMRWREKLAEVAGFPPLVLMEGFFDEKEWWVQEQRPNTKALYLRESAGEHGGGFAYVFSRLFAALPIKWDYFAADPLAGLLYHSDCDGRIPAKDCGPLADRLAVLLPRLPDVDAGGHIGNWREKTQTFIDGLRAAAAAGEDVEFH